MVGDAFRGTSMELLPFAKLEKVMEEVGMLSSYLRGFRYSFVIVVALPTTGIATRPLRHGQPCA